MLSAARHTAARSLRHIAVRRMPLAASSKHRAESQSVGVLEKPQGLLGRLRGKVGSGASNGHPEALLRRLALCLQHWDPGMSGSPMVQNDISACDPRWILLGP